VLGLEVSLVWPNPSQGLPHAYEQDKRSKLDAGLIAEMLSLAHDGPALNMTAWSTGATYLLLGQPETETFVKDDSFFRWAGDSVSAALFGFRRLQRPTTMCHVVKPRLLPIAEPRLEGAWRRTHSLDSMHQSLQPITYSFDPVRRVAGVCPRQMSFRNSSGESSGRTKIV
jgi:hypothetical protein